VNASIRPSDLLRLFLFRPAVHDTFLHLYPTVRSVSCVRQNACICRRIRVDDAGIVDLANHLVETAVTTTAKRHASILRMIAACDVSTYSGLYCRLWLQSKYDTTAALLDTIRSTSETWVLHERLGRVIGAFVPVFQDVFFQWLAIHQAVRRARRV
jgi:hypothetical protein